MANHNAALGADALSAVISEVESLRKRVEELERKSVIVINTPFVSSRETVARARK